jgi:hypothetical protein
MAKSPDKPDPMWADQFKPDGPGEDSEEVVEEEEKPLPPEQGSTES